MSSDSPSGGMKEIVRSLSKRERRTHWWNFTSSIITVFPLSPEHNMISGTNVKITKAHRCRWMWLNAGCTRTSSETKKHSIVEAQPQFRHPREHGFQLDAAHDVTAHHISISIHLRTQNTWWINFKPLFNWIKWYWSDLSSQLNSEDGKCTKYYTYSTQM